MYSLDNIDIMGIHKIFYSIGVFREKEEIIFPIDFPTHNY